MSSSLPVKTDEVRAYIALIPPLEEALRIRDRVSAVAQALKTAKASLGAQNEAAEVRLRLERYIGDELKDSPKNRGTVLGGNIVLPPDDTPTYNDLGVGKMQASRFQQEASVPDEVFEQHITETKDKGQEVTTAGVLKLANKLIREKRLAAKAKEQTQEAAVLHCCDCLSFLAEVPPISLLLTDPPYFTDGDFTGHISAYLAHVKPDGQAYVFMSAAPGELAAYLAMDSYHMVLSQMLVWNYNNTGQRQPKARYTSNYQCVLYYRGPDAVDINRPGDGTHQYACQTVNAPDGRVGDRYHEWQKPIALIERYILNSSQPGELVCDPFAGTGTVLLAAAKLGRKSLGCELNEATAQIAVDRGCALEI